MNFSRLHTFVGLLKSISVNIHSVHGQGHWKLIESGQNWIFRLEFHYKILKIVKFQTHILTVQLYDLTGFFLGWLALGWLCGIVLGLFLRETEVKQRWARLVHGWVTLHDPSRFVAQWGILMQPENRYLMTPGVRHSIIIIIIIIYF